MNLADYAAMPKGGNSGEFIKWTKNGETKVLRFLYTSKDGSDIKVVKKCWNDEEKKFVYDTPEGKPTCSLNAVLYEDGKEPRLVRWERSASFTEQARAGYWAKFPRIIDGVWEVTCTNPGTKEIKFSWFPVQGADLTTYPLPEGASIKDGRVVIDNGGAMEEKKETPAPPPTKAKKYWDD